MAISVDPLAFIDVRFDALAKSLRCSRDSALVRMMRVWHMCTELETDRLSAALLGPALRCKPERAPGILEACELGEVVDDDVVRIRGTNEKRTGWKGTQRERAEAPARLDGPRDLEAEIVASVAAKPAKSGNEIVRRLGARRATVLRAFNKLWDSGTLVRDGSGMVVVPGSDAGGSGNQQSGSGNQVVPPPPTPSPSPRNPLAGVPAHAREPVPVPAGEPEPHPRNAPAALARAAESIQSEPSHDRYLTLYKAWRAIVEREGAKARDPGPVAGRSAVHAALAAPELAGVTDAEVEHGLDMLGVQARALDQTGSRDPWWLLSSAWSPRVLRAAIDVPDERTARARALRRNQSGNRLGQQFETLPSKFEGDSR